MVERVAVLLGTVQFRLAIRIIVPENATIDDAEKAAWATIGDYPIKDWTLVDELGVGHPCPSHLTTLSRWPCNASETSVPDDQQPEILWERED